MLTKVLVANRGEIACRILRTARKLGIRTVAVYSEADRYSPHVTDADESVLIGAAPVAASYLRADVILEAARTTGAQAIAPGYGFLSESADFAAACETAGIAFVGPTAQQIRSFGLKHEARILAARAGVPIVPGTGLIRDEQHAAVEAARLGYPIMLKSTAGGGGIGLRVCPDEAALRAAFASVQRLARGHFGDGGAFLERFVAKARHVEVQIFGNGRGHVLALGERDCSTQRRNQKVIEETPAPRLTEATRERLADWAVRLAQEVSYRSAGTVEFVVDAATEEAFFLEVNTRLQVEHGVTEAVLGIDIVEWMLRLAGGDDCVPAHAPRARGAAIEVRLYAEDPAHQHRPSTGRLTEVAFPGDVRVDSWITTGTEVTPHYDPLLAKVIASGRTREDAVDALARALRQTRVAGIETNLAWLRTLIDEPVFREGRMTTRFLDGFAPTLAAIDVLASGPQSTVQDWPGRQGHWDVGVPPSGPMDDRAFRRANRLVGNAEGAAGLEMTLAGPTLRFRCDATIALTGARMPATVDGRELPWGQAFPVPAGATLKLGTVAGRGARAYLAISGGLDVPAYLGSRSTFLLGGFGGHAGRALRAGDVLPIGEAGTGLVAVEEPGEGDPSASGDYPEVWELGVLYGPHGAPDFFTAEDIDAFFAATWTVHHNSDRTGVRLIGPRPRWARTDGGEAGLHPSNIHDNAYAVGTVDFTGDMPILLGPDGPSLGGFVCPATLPAGERWKMGQLKAGDKVRFRRLDDHDAVVARSPARSPQPQVVYRRSGDEFLLIEYGPPVLDLALRMRVQLLLQALQTQRLAGIIDLTPGIRSLQVHFDPRILPAERLLSTLRAIEEDLPRVDEVTLPSRIVHLPLSWEDPATLAAIEKYMRVVRADAPWCPSNIEFIRRINGLGSVDDVKRIVFDARYLVLGLGDVYLGAPVATPLDPRHRLVTTKYNPARTWTPENAVGIGGAYLCIYGMEGPGGYQFVGRTLQVWNTWRSTPAFAPDRPWLLRFFDQIRFYPVSADELLAMRADFPHGRVPLRVEETTFSFQEYSAFLQEQARDIAAFKDTQQCAFDEERARWGSAPEGPTAAPPEPEPADALIPEGCSAVTSPVAGTLWKVLVAAGDSVSEGDAVAIVEAMKTEINVLAPAAGRVRTIVMGPGGAVHPGQPLVVMEP